MRASSHSDLTHTPLGKNTQGTHHTIAPTQLPCRSQQQTAWQVVKRHIYLKDLFTYIHLN